MRKALVVDDSKSWVDYHTSNLLNIYEDLTVDKAYSAREGYDWIYNMISEPYNLVITDLHMEYDFDPKYAGEWLVEQIKLLTQYLNTKIIISSAAYDIKQIAENLVVDYMPKRIASQNKDVYAGIL